MSQRKNLQRLRAFVSQAHAFFQVSDLGDLRVGGMLAGRFASQRLKCTQDNEVLSKLFKRRVGHARAARWSIDDQPFVLENAECLFQWGPAYAKRVCKFALRHGNARRQLAEQNELPQRIGGAVSQGLSRTDAPDFPQFLCLGGISHVRLPT